MLTVSNGAAIGLSVCLSPWNSRDQTSSWLLLAPLFRAHALQFSPSPNGRGRSYDFALLECGQRLKNMWDCGSKSNGSNLGKRALPWRMTVRSGLEGSTAAAVNDSTLIHGEGTFLAAARGATQLMKKQIFKANKLLNWLSNVQTSRKVGGPFFDRLPPPRRRSSFAELCVFIELLPPCICGRNPFDRIEVRVESHGGKGFLSPPLSSPHARVRTRTPGACFIK